MITHDRWQRIKEIFQSAQELAPPERSGFLDAACGDDELIREEVEALLTADADNDDFLSAPAYEFAASLLVAEETEFSAGQRVGRYEVLCPLGSGGMGQIYLARDTQLGRKIALKLISPQFASDERRVHRFAQEARAISALNHPNICVIHEIGVTENKRHFIAMEHIQGSTVRDRLSRGGFTVFEAVNVAVQVAAALATAHATGIVHRDIKPENIMLRPDDYVKVLDFGLAKLVEVLPEQQGWHGVTTNLRTEAGTLMGTVKYMSPEQLREADVDERTDIWSLGVVLYEMLANSTPFEARTSNDTVALILSSQSVPMSFPAALPGKLKAIVAKALEKDADKRYQTVSRLASDLRAVQRELRAAEGESSLLHDEDTRELPVGSALITRIKSQAISTADFLISEIRSHKAAAAFAAATSILVLLFFLPNFLPTTKPTAGISALTNSGNIITSAISPDGKVLAHAEEAQGKQRLFVTAIATSSRFEVADPANVEYLGLVFSRDNNYLYFTRREDGNDALYRLPVMSTSPVKVKDDVHSPIAFSPNGDRFAFVRLNKATSEYHLVLSNVDGTNEQSLATRRNGDTLSVYGVAWSPDGAMVVCPVSTWTDGFHVTLMGFDVKTKSARTLSDQWWFSILQVAWQDDMSGFVISARERETAPHQLWRITYPAGAAERLTRDQDEYTGVSLAGNKIVTVKTVRSWSVWVTSFDESTRSSPIAPGTGLTYGITWARDGKIVYSAMTAQGRLNLTRIDPDGSNRVPLTDAGDNYNPAASADGQFIVFSSNRSGRFNIWRINSNDGSDARPLTFTDGNFYPSVSPDNQWVAYDRQTDLTLSIWKVPLQGGEPIKLIEGYRMPVFSPDNQLIAGRYDHESGTTDVAIFPAAGGEPLKRFTIPMLDWQRVHWIDGHTLSFISEASGASNIWAYDFNAGTSKQLTNFDSERIYAYAWSPDLKQLVSQRGHKVSDAMMITGTPISQGGER